MKIHEAMARKHSPHLWDGTYKSSLENDFSKIMDEEEIDQLVEHHQNNRLTEAKKWLDVSAGMVFISTPTDLMFIVLNAPSGTVLMDVDENMWVVNNGIGLLATVEGADVDLIDIMPLQLVQWGLEGGEDGEKLFGL